MTNEELELYADQYCIDKFGAKTGNKYVRDALIDGYNLALRIHNVVGRNEQLPILNRCECEEPNEEPIKVCKNCNGYVE